MSVKEIKNCPPEQWCEALQRDGHSLAPHWIHHWTSCPGTDTSSKRVVNTTYVYHSSVATLTRPPDGDTFQKTILTDWVPLYFPKLGFPFLKRGGKEDFKKVLYAFDVCEIARIT